MAKRLTAIEKDFRVSPSVFFRLKKDALKAQEQATSVGIRTRLRRTAGGTLRWVLSKA